MQKDLNISSLLQTSEFEGLSQSFFEFEQKRCKTPDYNGPRPNLPAPQRVCGERIGAEMSLKSKVHFIDSIANNETIAQNADQMVKMMLLQDEQYYEAHAYGIPDYLISVEEKNVYNKPSLLIPERQVSFHNQKQKIAAADVINAKDVLKGIDYICQVTFKECYSLETQFFASALFHLTLSNLEIPRQQVKLLSALCVLVATKIEENYGEALGTSALCEYFSNTFTVQNLLEGELRLYKAISWRPGICSLNARAYLRCLFRDLGVKQEIALISEFLAELLLLTGESLRFPAYTQSLGCLQLASISYWLLYQKTDITSTNIIYQKANFECNEFVLREWKQLIKEGQNTEIYIKYSEPSMFNISVRFEPIESYIKCSDKFKRWYESQSEVIE